VIASMLNVVSSAENRINGLSISPKRGFNIIKVWNADAQKFSQPSNLHAVSNIRESEIIYTPFLQKKM
jgi:hypothetical protein